MLPRGAIEFYPVAYVRQLKNAGLNGMRMAFLMYWDDYCDRDVKSNRYYANVWCSDQTNARAAKKRGMSPTTAGEWIAQFQGVIDNFEAFGKLTKRAGEQSAQLYAKKRTGQTGQVEPDTFDTTQMPSGWDEMGVKNDRTGQTGQVEPDQVFNNTYTPTKAPATDGEFFYLYQTCRMANANVGSREAAFDAWKQVEGVQWRDMAVTYLLYMRDYATHDGKPYGLANFIRNGVYLSYARAKVRVRNSNGTCVDGYYDMQAEQLLDEAGKPYALKAQTFMSMIIDGRVEFLNGIRVKVR